MTTTSIITLCEPSLREAIDRSVSAGVRVAHVDTMEIACAEARSMVIGTLLISPSIVVYKRVMDLQKLLREAPGVSPVAVIGVSNQDVKAGLLLLGALGVRSVVDVSDRDGMQTIRAHEAEIAGDVTAEILQCVLEVLSDASPTTRQFFATLVRAAPTTNSKREFARKIHVHPSTILSRFFRASLPSPKLYLAKIRMLYVAHFLSNPSVGVSTVALQLGYSSAQHLHRHLRDVHMVTPHDVRSIGFPNTLRDVARDFFVRYRAELRTFNAMDESHVLPSRHDR